MPKTSSAKKALRQGARRRAMNLERLKKMKAAVKSFRKSALSGEKEKLEALLKEAYKSLDKLAKKGVIKRGKADRLKSRLAKKLGRKQM